MVSNRIQSKFAQIKAEQRTGLVLFVTAGFPDMQTTEELVPALVEAGADAVEIGVPFSDPLADGSTIQASSFHALKQGVTLKDCIDLVSRLRLKVPNTPLILMGYYNPIYSFGLKSFCNEAADAQLDGIIVADLPTEESEPLLKLCRPAGLDLIPLLAPTSTDSRISKACLDASGFIYCVSVTGVTGARKAIPSQINDLVSGVRKHTQLPIAVGFGVSNREHMQALGVIADAVIVGSALVRTIQDADDGCVVSEAVRFVRGILGNEQVENKGISR